MVGSARKALLDVFLDRVTCPMTGSSFELKLHADHYKALASKRADASELCCFFSALTDYILLKGAKWKLPGGCGIFDYSQG